MNIYTSFNTKVGRRILLLFICCALLPIGVLSFLSFFQVVSQLNRQSQERLHQATKVTGMGIFERLTFLESEMKVLLSYLPEEEDIISQTRNYINEHLEERIKTLLFFKEDYGMIPIFGNVKNPLELIKKAMQHSMSSKTSLTSLLVENCSGYQSQIFLVMSVDPQNLKEGILLAEIRSDYLWGVAPFNTLPPMTELCVLNKSKKDILFSSIPLPSFFQKQLAFDGKDHNTRHFEWKSKDNTYLSSSWDIFLESKFSTPMWTIVLSQSNADIREPVNNFKKTFPLVAFMSIWVVLFLSSIYIRKSLIPLEKLKEGTRRISAKEFNSRVSIVSGDEFEELGDAFNSMSAKLGRQFNALGAMAAVSQNILLSLNTKKIIKTVLTGVLNIFQCDIAGISIIHSHDTKKGRTYVGKKNSVSEKNVEPFTLLPEDVRILSDNPIYFFTERNDFLLQCLSPLARDSIQSFLIFPIFLKGKLSGFIAIGFINSTSVIEDDIVQGRQLADQVGVALSNAQMVKDLYHLNWGTLKALARTVDTKSPWTAGHSERVTKLALRLGHVFNFDTRELEILRRGALLHDLGKIGIPSSILDKPDPLTDEEYSLIKKHPAIGSSILEPIKAYSKVLPMVLHHHERFDGKGYPEGLSGKTISLGARILAVCDVYDALTSNRPYRRGLTHEDALELINRERGKQFDPKVVEAFLETINNKKKKGHEDRISRSKGLGISDIIENEIPVDQSIIKPCV